MEKGGRKEKKRNKLIKSDSCLADAKTQRNVFGTRTPSSPRVPACPISISHSHSRSNITRFHFPFPITEPRKNTREEKKIVISYPTHTPQQHQLPILLFHWYIVSILTLTCWPLHPYSASSSPIPSPPAWHDTPHPCHNSYPRVRLCCLVLRRRCLCAVGSGRVGFWMRPIHHCSISYPPS